MTETTTTFTEPPSQTVTGPTIPTNPSDILISLIVTLLAPMFLGAAGGDIGFARMAAIETVSAYRARNLADLIAIAQIIGYGLAALGSLSLSMADDLSLSMTLRLRGNANALTRSAERNRRALENTRSDNMTSHHPAIDPESEAPAATEAGDENEAAMLAGVTAARKLAAETRAHVPAEAQATQPVPTLGSAPIATPAPASQVTIEQRNQAQWASAMIKEAEKLSASLNKLPPAERRQASLRVATLTTTASGILAALGGALFSPAIPAPRMPPASA